MSPRSLLLAGAAALILPASSKADELTLEQCRTTARLQHPSVALARAQTAAATARAAIALSGYLPEITADGSFLATRGSGGASLGTGRGPGGAQVTPPISGSRGLLGPADFELWSGGFTVRQVLWDFGRTTNRYEAASAATDEARAQEQATREAVDLAAEATFRAALASEELVAAMEEAKRQAETHLALAKGRAEVGLQARYDVSRAEVEVADAEYRLIQATNARNLSHASLASACGYDELPEGTALVPAPPRTLSEVPSLAAAVEEAGQNLPEVRAAALAVEVAAQRLDGAWSQILPSLGATGNVGLRGTSLDQLEPGWTATVSLSIPIIAGGADLGGIREARANLAAAQANQDAILRALRLDVQSGMIAADEARARLAASQKREAAAKEGMRLAEGRYQTGLGSVLELADAQATLASARADRVRSALDLSVASAYLERLLGRWSDER
ncbi:TolC family protein [Vulgatibacter incomptus]|uniref:Outer membrane efflux protein n=1 Tax=Vulgatibacter incomptus TaxID=1391653 RepID=A0A0K1PAZ6_9BACT|nr:TolC family protein [Vulgatibacter incomptus]AKU90284.1 outer membrane efflux protein [Vulgatibacter incomptus]